MDGPGFKSRKGPHFSLLQNRPDALCDTPSLLLNDYQLSFSLLKRPGREADHLPPNSAEVKNKWSYASAPPYAFMAWTGTTLHFLPLVHYVTFQTIIILP